MKLEKLQPGMTVYDVGRTKMGNTTMKTTSVWPVFIVSVDLEKRCVIARWNGNEPKKNYSNEFTKWREKEPLRVKQGFGYRLATREERNAMKAATQPIS